MSLHSAVSRRTLVASLVVVVIIVVAVVAYYLATLPSPTQTQIQTTPTPTYTQSPTQTQASPVIITTATQTPSMPTRTLRVLLAFPIQTDPALAIDWASLQSVNNIYDSLIRLGSNGEPDPSLSIARSWNVSEDGRVWTFYLRSGVKFHSGRELTADDVVFSVQRLLTIGMGPASVFAPYIDRVQAIDKYTVQIQLKRSFGPFLYALTLLYILDKEEVMSHIKPTGEYGQYGDYGKEWLRSNDAGSGPYKIKEHVFGERLVLERFKDYWGYVNPHAPDEVTLLPPPAPAAQVNLFLTGDIDITYSLPTETVLELMKNPNISVAKQLYGTQFIFVLNTKKPPLDDVHFRRALAYAFNYNEAINSYIPGLAWPAVGPVASYLPGAPKDLKFYTTNLAAAREELQRSKYYNELSKYPIELWWVAEVPQEEVVALIFVNSIKQLDPNIQIEVIKKPWASVVEATATINSTPHITILLSTPIYPETGSVLQLKFHSEYAGKSIVHVSWLLNSTIDSLIDDALSTIDDNARFEKYKYIIEQLNNMVPEIIAYDYANAVLYWGSYIKWPAGEGKPPYAVQYMYDFRFIEVYPEKKAELFGK